MEKKRPSYNLYEIKKCFSTEKYVKEHITKTARIDSINLDLSIQDIIEIIQNIKITNFIKSMTIYKDNKIWQDVYYVPFKNINLYIKFMVPKNENNFLLISFKER